MVPLPLGRSKWRTHARQVHARFTKALNHQPQPSIMSQAVEVWSFDVRPQEVWHALPLEQKNLLERSTSLLHARNRAT